MMRSGTVAFSERIAYAVTRTVAQVGFFFTQPEQAVGQGTFFLNGLVPTGALPLGVPSSPVQIHTALPKVMAGAGAA